MTTTTFMPNKGLTVGNQDRQISRVRSGSEDFSLFNQSKTIQRIRVELQSSSVVTTFSENQSQQVENIFFSKEPLIQERNNILDNPFKYYNPYYRVKLKKIDEKLDELDLQLYVLESKNKANEADIDKAIKSAALKLKNILNT